MQFEITLKNEKAKTYRFIILFFVIVHIIFFIYLLFDGGLLKKGIIGSVIIADLFLLILGKTALQKTTIYFNTSGIKKRNYPSKKYPWDQFTNVILKDNILTLDFKNNKLLQAAIETTNVNENAFNTFAKEQLVKSN